MSTKSGNVRHKNQALVKVTLAGQEPFDATVFLAIGDRLIDLLNDDRAFIPVKRSDGDTIIVAKTQIISIVEADAEMEEEAPEAADNSSSPQRKKFDPYAMLRIAPDASVDEIRAAYKSRLKAVHPDSIAALGLDDELTKAALQTTQKLNYAYRKIMKDLEDAPEEQQQEEAAQAAG